MRWREKRGSQALREKFGVWLSLARAPGLGPGGRRFESCHPDVLYEVTGMRYVVNSFYAGVVQW